MRFLIIFISLFLYAKEYSIQVYSANKLDKVLPIYNKFKNYKNTRIEKIGNYYTLRIGKVKKIKKLKKILKIIKKEYKNAFIRNIDWKPQRIVHLNLKFIKKDKTKLYSIQVYTSENLKMAILVYDRLKNYPYDRIEKIGDYYVVRVFKAKTIKKLRKLLINIQKLYPRAFMRNIDWKPKRIIKINKKNKIKIFNIFDFIDKNKPKEIKKRVSKEQNISKDINSTKLDLPLYAKLSLDLVKNDKTSIDKLLEKHHNQLPVRDRVQAEIQTGNIKRAYNDVYFNMKNDYSDYLSYKQAIDLYIKYSNRITILTKLNNLDKINTIDNSMSAKIYIFNPYYLYIKSDLIVSKNNNPSYKNIQSFDNDTKIGLEKLTNRDSLYAEIGERISKENFYEFLLKYNTIITKYISYEGSIGVNQKSSETPYLLYAGKTNYFN